MRVLYLSLASLSFALATAGVFLPVLPTTPFLLLTSWFLMRSSPRLHARLLASPLFGPLLADWARDRGVRLHVKVTALAVLALVTGATLVGTELALGWKALLLSLAALGATVILRLKTVRGAPAPLAAPGASPDDVDGATGLRSDLSSGTQPSGTLPSGTRPPPAQPRARTGSARELGGRGERI